ncbi:hypothetical protein MSG28_013255 [Choristoneura fumiferana]|uniref:Uncharacterized protein n=1 Tax=Choristoneura fumiferana TaxID=7141 RepID=A0ACC0KSW1_CHOFU|nr:hypothetical protein MSG28_013255 [Choristoneura fumiferana]
MRLPALAELERLSAERALVDAALRRARERHAVVIQLDHGVRRLARHFHIRIKNDEFSQYIGGSPEEVHKEYTEDSYGWSVVSPFHKRTSRTMALTCSTPPAWPSTPSISTALSCRS